MITFLLIAIFIQLLTGLRQVRMIAERDQQLKDKEEHIRQLSDRLLHTIDERDMYQDAIDEHLANTRVPAPTGVWERVKERIQEPTDEDVRDWVKKIQEGGR